MNDFMKYLVATSIVSFLCLISIRVKHIEGYIDCQHHNMSDYEVTPETFNELDGEICKPYRMGLVPGECACECKFKVVETGRYFLKKKCGAK